MPNIENRKKNTIYRCTPPLKYCIFAFNCSLVQTGEVYELLIHNVCIKIIHTIYKHMQDCKLGVYNL